MNFIAKNYRFKCEHCSNLCDMFFYMEKRVCEDFLKASKIVCDECYKKDQESNAPNFNKDNFECTSIFSLLNSPDCKI